ncbi:MAG: hypothetical protein N3E37_00835 [Candidatus Micrarchaeota archaeon]|nr:hypothetical protein [Candidatus Micrarchaeota archaeon]
MQENIDFFELVLLQTINSKKDTAYLEKLPAEMNSSFYEIANRTGSLRLKELIEIKSSIGTTELVLTAKAKDFLSMIEKKTEEKQHLDHLSKEVLKCIANNMNELYEIQKSLNIRETDLTINLYTLYKKELIDYTCQNNTVKFVLTEKGFSKAYAEKLRSEDVKEKAEKRDEKPKDQEETEEDVKELLKEDSNTKSSEKKVEVTNDKKDETNKIKVYDSKLEYYLHKYWIVLLLILIVVFGIVVYYLMNR